MYKTLTIAGSDSGGGAGIQADLKTFSALGTFGMSVITSITAQNTVGVTGIQNVDPSIIEKQIDAVMDDIGTHAAKTGMLSDTGIIETVARGLIRHGIKKYVLDPVMIAKSGDKLLQDSAITTLINQLIPLAWIITPNIPEAEELTGDQISTLDAMEIACKKIYSMGARSVIVKGGHLKGRAVDVFFDGKKFHHFSSHRIRSKNTHGTGCTFSAAITAFLAKGFSAYESVKRAKDYITKAIEHSFPIGKGHGPVDHFYRFNKFFI
ncbi:bifunctional hydroxymethylpyrimidine kinase/phosphomethylpyrimidine kinase [bacterium]|nr:bifunctional hydroxymethylpyrimidine kinase/phosphomethylpyrimidine kinase [bacterium]